MRLTHTTNRGSCQVVCLCDRQSWSIHPPTYKHTDLHAQCFVTLCHSLPLGTFLLLTATETHTDTLNKHTLHRFIRQPFRHNRGAWDSRPQYGEYNLTAN